MGVYKANIADCKSIFVKLWINLAEELLIAAMIAFLSDSDFITT